MKQLVLTGFTGPNPKYPLSDIAQFILSHASCADLAMENIMQDLEAILAYRKGFGGSILLGLDDEDQMNGVVAVLPPVDHRDSTLVYFATTTEIEDAARVQLLRSVLKITRGIIRVDCDLRQADKSWMPEAGYHFHPSELTISRIGG